MRLNIGREVEALGEDLAERAGEELLKRCEGAGHRDVRAEVRNRQETQHIVQHRAADNAQQDGAFHVAVAHDGNRQQRDDGHNHRHDAHVPAIREQVEGRQRDTGGCARNDDARILQAKERDEQTDARRNRDANRLWNRLEDELAQTRDGQEDEQNTVKKHQHEGIGIAEAQPQHDRVNEVGIQTHAGRLRERQVRQQTNCHRADDGGNGGGDVNRAVGHAGDAGEHARIDHQDIRHCKEGRQTRQAFGLERAALGGVAKVPIKRACVLRSSH